MCCTRTGRTGLNLKVELEYSGLEREGLKTEEKVCADTQRMGHQGLVYLKRVKGRKGLVETKPV